MSNQFSLNHTAYSSRLNIIFIAIALFSLSLPFWGPDHIDTDWSFNHLNFLPGYIYYIVMALSALVLAVMFVSPKEHTISVLLREWFWGEKKKIGRIGATLAAVIIFIVFKIGAQLYGDSYILISSFAQSDYTSLPWYEFGGKFAPYMLYQLFELIGMEKVTAALWSFRALSILSGGLFIYISFKTVDLLSDDPDDKIALLFMTWFAGFVFLFFGFIEQTPLLFIVGVLLTHQIISFSLEASLKKALLILALFLIGLFIDIYFLSTIPVVLYILSKSLVKRKKIGSFIGSIAAYFSIIVGLSTIYFLSVGNIFLENYLLYFTGKQPATSYTLISMSRLSDIFNLFFYASPIFIAMAAAIVLRLRYLKEDKIFISLGLLTIGQLAALFILDPINGFARDHHNFFFLTIGFIYLGGYSLLRLKEDNRLSKDIFMALSPAALMVVLPMLAVHLYFPATEKYLDNYLDKNEYKYESALFAFRDYHYLAEEYKAADAREQSIRGKTPGILESNLINDLYGHKRVDEAMEYAIRLTERFPYNPVYRIQKGNLLKYFRKYSEAEVEYLTALTLDKYRPESYHFMSELYREINIEPRCRETIDQGLKIAPKYKPLLLDLTGYYLRAGNHKAVDSLCKVMLKIDPNEPYAYMYQGFTAEGAHRYQEAMKHYEKFVSLNDQLPETGPIRKRINNLYLLLNDTTSQSE